MRLFHFAEGGVSVSGATHSRKMCQATGFGRENSLRGGRDEFAAPRGLVELLWRQTPAPGTKPIWRNDGEEIPRLASLLSAAEGPPMAVFDHWHPVLFSNELRKKPVGVRLCGKELVLFRGAGGEAAALDDICPH